ncbi:hypothetical protein AYL99_11818 [Fonsecaea erecta]|uniref:Uncharacterized protein n=1 Tax=Fonsecaea erecta TaxID=1367422 RepID=A0A178Z2A2_9EURO|nr:hypothetical protein AYL99_11818 [Fonsecaea erecta]OAP53938.1 hypothetical protein AYL99_11818 [Fonsecaea erecta]
MITLKVVLETVPDFRFGLYSLVGATYTSTIEHMVWGRVTLSGDNMVRYLNPVSDMFLYKDMINSSIMKGYVVTMMGKDLISLVERIMHPIKYYRSGRWMNTITVLLLIRYRAMVRDYSTFESWQMGPFMVQKVEVTKYRYVANLADMLRDMESDIIINNRVDVRLPSDSFNPLYLYRDGSVMPVPDVGAVHDTAFGTGVVMNRLLVDQVELPADDGTTTLEMMMIYIDVNRDPLVARVTFTFRPSCDWLTTYKATSYETLTDPFRDFEGLEAVDKNTLMITDTHACFHMMPFMLSCQPTNKPVDCGPLHEPRPVHVSDHLHHHGDFDADEMWSDDDEVVDGSGMIQTYTDGHTNADEDNPITTVVVMPTG